MEAQIAAADEQLIPGLSYKLPAAASFIVDRSAATFWPEGGNQYTPTGVKVLRYTLSSHTDYIDPHTMHLAFTLRNDSADTNLVFRAHNPLTVFSRMRLLASGTLVEDQMYYGRVCAMQDLFTPPARRFSRECLQGFPRDASAFGASTYAMNNDVKPIPPGESVKVCCPIYAGICQQHLLVPMKYCPLTFEFELNARVAAYTATGSSTAFTISDARILADVVQVDGALEERVAKHLQSGKGLPLSLSTWSTTMNTITPSITNGAFAIQLARAFSRVKTFFGSMSSGAGGDGTEVYEFLHPMNSSAYRADRDVLEWSLHIGAKTMPQYPVKSVAESAFHLQKALGLTVADEGLGDGRPIGWGNGP